MAIENNTNTMYRMDYGLDGVVHKTNDAALPDQRMLAPVETLSTKPDVLKGLDSLSEQQDTYVEPKVTDRRMLNADKFNVTVDAALKTFQAAVQCYPDCKEITDACKMLKQDYENINFSSMMKNAWYRA